MDDDGSSATERDLVRQVTRAVVARIGDAGPAVVEAVVSEVIGSLERSALATATPATPASNGRTGAVTTPRGATLLPTVGNPPDLQYCMACVESERSRARSRAILTTTGRNTKGIVARVTARIAELGGDILDISQTLVGGWFTMIIVVDVSALDTSFERFRDEIEAAVKEMGCQAMLMHEGVMASLHRV